MTPRRRHGELGHEASRIEPLEGQTGAPAPGQALWLRRLQDRYTAPASPQPMLPLSDAAKYAWIRANRGSFAILEALKSSERDADFDLRIEAAMRLAAAGRHVPTQLADPAP